MQKSNRAHLKNVAYQQQINHLAQAQTQALKILVEQQKPCKLTVENALAYYDLVKIKLGPQQFPEFLEIMRENRNPNSDCMTVISKICHLFKNYPDLLQGFGMFLPASVNLQVQTAGRFLVKGEKNEIFPLFIKTEDDYDPNRSTESTLTAVSESDSTMDDLEEENEEQEKAESISKDSRESEKVDSDYATNYLTKVKERFLEQPDTYLKFIQILESVRKDYLENERTIVETDVFNDIVNLFTTHEDLIEQFKFFVPNAKFPDSPEQDPIPDEPNPEIEIQSQNEDSFPLTEPPNDEVPKYSFINDPSVAPVGKYGSYKEHLFFDKIREALYHREVYDNFLRCLMLFNEDVITRSELVKIATPFLGKFPDLLKELKDMLGFNESGNNIETIPMKIIKYENQRRDPEFSLELGFATGGRYGSSYRALSKDAKQPKCSGRTVLCKEVLNDTFVSFPSWSEDSTFVTSCKTEYEEMIYRCEDERFELDMAINANAYTIQVLENVQKKINKLTSEERSVFSLDDTLGGTSTVLHQKALHRCYGDKTDELVEGLKRNPIIAVPIILKRLRNKEEEWKEKQKHFNNIWKDQISNYYIKSLDHQGINFKQNDSKSFRSKSLLNEMEMVFAEKKENSVPNGSSFHFLLEFKEKSVFYDAINLICQYLKKLPGIYRDDRRRIELVIRHFIPDFFNLPRTTIVENETVDENDNEAESESSMEEMDDENETEAEERPRDDIDNDAEERNGHTSPCESGTFSKYEEMSEGEESNSAEENEMSEESDKNSFIEDSDIFDKLDTVLTTNLPYTLFFVSKSWYVFFRQFHILCQRLTGLFYASSKKETHIPIKTEKGLSDGEYDGPKPPYPKLINKLSQLLTGSIDSSQFEDEARSLFGIHAFVTFTMDKLILNIVRQLQQIVGDDMCKQCTALFFKHNKIIANATFSSPLESARVEKDYLKRVERVLNDEKCFKVLWHKKEVTLTIELIEHVVEHADDPYEVEKWSNYLDAYLDEDNVVVEVLTEVPFLPVFLPRNLRKQKEFWKRKVLSVENLWNKRHSPSYLKKNLPTFRKRKAFEHSSPVPSKISHISTEKLDETMSVCSEIISVEPDNAMETSISQQIINEVSDCDKTADSDKFDDITKLTEKENENIGEIFADIEMGSEVLLNEFNISENSNPSVEAKCQDSESIQSFTAENSIFCSNINDMSNEGSIFYSQLTNFSGIEKGDITLDSNDGSMSMRDEHLIDSVAAFHDITEEVTNDVVIEVNQEETETVDNVTIETVTVETGTIETETVETVTIETETVEAEIVDVETVEAKTDESKTVKAENDEAKIVKAETDEAKTVKAKTDEAKTVKAKTDEAKTVKAKTDEAKTVKAKTDEAKTVKAQNVETKTVKTETVESETVESETVESEKSIEIITVDDSDDGMNIVCETEPTEEKEKTIEPSEDESRPRRERAVRKAPVIKLRRNKPSQEYVRRRSRRNAARAQRERKAKNARKELEDFDYATFDYSYFSELSEEDKYEYLAMQHLIILDETEGKFKQENYKMIFVQNCNMFLYRMNCLSKAKEIHQQICEIKTSNFNAWHQVWLDRYVTPTMVKFCNDWFHRSDPEKYKLICIAVNDCTKPPYILYNKYRIRHYKTDT